MEIISIIGDGFEFGIELGKRFSTAIRYRLGCLNITKEFCGANKEMLDKLFRTCLEKKPELIDELRGIAEGSHCEVMEIFCLNLLELPEITRCSTIITREKEIIIAHNEDGDPFEKKEDFAIIKRMHNGLTIYNLNYPGELAGSSFCWNSKGLIIAVNNVRYRKLNLEGLPRTFIARMIIDSGTIEEAIDIIKKNVCASGFHYTLAQGERVISVEQHNNRVSVVEIDHGYYHTNHYLHNYFKDELVITENSKIRYSRIKEMLEEKKEMLPILFDRKDGRNSIYGYKTDENQTMATFLAYPQRGKVLVYPNDDEKAFMEIGIE